MCKLQDASVCVIYQNAHSPLSSLHSAYMHVNPLFLCKLQLIARLKQEVQSLKEELTMLTGEERDGQLTMEEIKKYVLDFVLLPCFNSALSI